MLIIFIISNYIIINNPFQSPYPYLDAEPMVYR
jgi:hypothetical protein